MTYKVSSRQTLNFSYDNKYSSFHWKYVKQLLNFSFFQGLKKLSCLIC